MHALQLTPTTFMRKDHRRSSGLDAILKKLVEVDSEMQVLPPLSALDKVKLEHERDIEHLYFSSKLEGATLTYERLHRAILGATL